MRELEAALRSTKIEIAVSATPNFGTPLLVERSYLYDVCLGRMLFGYRLLLQSMFHPYRYCLPLDQ